VVGLLVCALACGTLAPRAASSKAPSIAIPLQAPQPITRTSPGAQVAWLSLAAGLGGYDAAGKRVAEIPLGAASAGSYGFWRSADGAAIFTLGADRVYSYAALDGKLLSTYQRLPGYVVEDTFSPDGHYLALVLLNAGAYQLEVIDLRNGTSQSLPVAHDPNAQLPGMSGAVGSIGWAMPVFGPDSAHLYTVTDWGGPLRVSAFDLTSGKLRQLLTSVDGQAGNHLPSCAGPAMAMKVAGDGSTLVAFCHFDGKVWFFDLRTLTSSGVVDPRQANPFWLAPIFTPDGQRLYLHQPPGFGDQMEMIDLTTRKLFGPASTPQKLSDGGIFAWLTTPARAGGIPSTVPISPDGLKLYSATSDGVLVLRVPDLKLIARLAKGIDCDEVWISGDGRTVFATAGSGKTLVVLHDDGTGLHTTPLPVPVYGFIASEHG
jgi:WD40 repeat protein